MTRPTRAVLCTSGGLPGALVLGRLLRCPSLQVAGIVHSTRILRAEHGFLRGAWAQYRLSGAAYTLYLWCATSLADWLSNRGPQKSVAALASKRGIPVLKTRDVNAAAGRDFVAATKPDLLVSAFFNQRLSPALLGIPRVAALNIHPSLLPDYRGVDPVFYSMLRRAPGFGVTLHHLTPELDAGNILVQAEVPVEPASSVLRTTAVLYARGAGLLAGRLPKIATGDPGTPQAAGGCYDSWPTRDQVRRLRAGGTALVNPSDLIEVARGRQVPG
ncbi:MAG TPA: formyltransferase family protein [Rhodocyclaceae bacterium]|nr:formyltransferase family protein [Rhodocyclaceae bacterium]